MRLLAARLWRVALPRILADILIVAASLLAGLLARLMPAMGTPGMDSALLLTMYSQRFFETAPLLAAILVATFAITGVYTKKRFYTQRYKVLALAHGISISYAVFLLAAYLFRPGDSLGVPRSALVISYALTLAGSIGMRCVKSYLVDQFRIESKKPVSNEKPRNVLVVGGAGYVGSVLVRDLLVEGYRVRVLDSLVGGDESICQLYGHPEFELVVGDFRRVEPVVRAARGMAAVIHLGAIVGDPACAVDEDETLETNLAATRLLADVCRASGAGRILFASTCSVYGAADHLVDERSRLNPVSLYAATKIDSEKVLLAARCENFHPVILRLATAFGWSYRPRFDLVVNLLAARAAVDKAIQIFNGSQWRPFIHVSDISRAFRLMLRAPLEAVSGEIFNVGSNAMNLTLTQVAQQIALLEPGLRVEHTANADRRDYRVSFDKIHSRLGFECRKTLTDGAREIQQALARGVVTDYRDPRYSNVQLISQRAHRHPNGGSPNGDIELTALRFAKNSSWWRALTAGTTEEALLQHTIGLAALARALNQPAPEYPLNGPETGVSASPERLESPPPYPPK